MHPSLGRIVGVFAVLATVVVVAGVINLGLGIIAIVIAVPLYHALLY